MAFTLSKMIFAITTVVMITSAIIIVVTANPASEDISYDSSNGTIIVHPQEAIADSQWSAYIYVEHEKDSSKQWDEITHDTKVSISSDRKSVTITNDSKVLVNLADGHYQVRLVPSDSSLKTLEFNFDVNSDVFSSDGFKLIAIFIGFCILMAVAVIAGRIYRGKW